MMKVSFDVESVLAEPNEPVLDATDRLEREQIEGTWFNNEEDSLGLQIYMGVSDAIWRHSPHTIPPEEPNIAEHVEQVYDSVDQLDIVTHRQHVDEQVIWWLEHHDVPYDDFISTDTPKNDLDYDVWVDDNPNLVGECRLLLRHQPWNDTVDTDRMKSCDRIHTLADAADFF